jgi:hypothetical protein
MNTILRTSAALSVLLIIAPCSAKAVKRFSTGSVNLSLCSRTDNVAYWDLPSKLNHFEAFCGGVPNCSLSNIETKTIASYGNISQWLWYGPSNATFTIAQQDAIRATARSLGNANRPSGKSLVRVSYFTDFPVGNGDYNIGAIVKYATCTRTSPPT